MIEKEINISNSDNISEYYRLAGFIKGVTRKSDVSLLLQLSNLADQNGQFDLTTKARDSICEHLNLNKPNLSAAIKRLMDLNIVVGSKGSYNIDSDVYIDNKDVNEIRLSINLIK